MSTELQIRHEIPGDESEIHQLVACAFPGDAEAKLIDNLRSSRRLLLSLVALIQDEIVGHIAFSPVSLNGVEIGWGLAPVATLPERQRQGVASQMIEQGMEIARNSGVRCAVVLGEPAFYSRFGFRSASLWNLRDEYHGGEAFQAIEFVPEGIPPDGGLVTYSPEFSGF